MEDSRTTSLVSFAGKFVELLLLRGCPHIAIRVEGTSNCILKWPGEKCQTVLVEKLLDQFGAKVL